MVEGGNGDKEDDDDEEEENEDEEETDKERIPSTKPSIGSAAKLFPA